MKTSPVQLQQLVFEKLCVEVDAKHAPAEEFNASRPFAFDNVLLHTEVGFGQIEEAPPEEHVFEVGLELRVDNKRSKEHKNQRFCPYQLHLRARCLVRLLDSALGNPQDLAVVNGAALLWSAMREQVATITCRMVPGQIVLPTVHFQDLRSDIAKPTQQALPAAEPAKA